MIYAIVGAGGKTSLLKEMAARFRREGKSVFATTTTRMFIEEDMLLTEDAAVILDTLRKDGYAFAGIPEAPKVTALPAAVYAAACEEADVVLVEADGSKHMPLKYPNDTEPVIPENTDEIIVVCGLNAIGQRAKDVCHRLELVKACLGIEDETIITPAHIRKLVTDGYLDPLRVAYPNAKITCTPRHDGSLYQRAITSLLQNGQDVSIISQEWFRPQPKLFICGGGHVAKEVAAIAARLDFRIRIIDDRPEILTGNYFPAAAEVICDSYDHLPKYLEPGACYIVVTPNHKADYKCVSAILAGC